MATPRRERTTARSLPSILLLAACLGAPLAGFSQAAPQELPRPCEGGADSARHRQLDFWVGDWRVLGSEGQELGTSRITSRAAGCLIVEEWRSARGGGSGLGTSFVDGEDGRWHQVWVGSTGTVVRYEGALRDGAMRFQGRTVAADGTVSLSRATLEPVGEGEARRVRQRVERSSDGGTTWTLYFDGVYVPASAPVDPPAPAPAPAPVPSPAPAPQPSPPPSQVTAVSVEIPDEEVPIEQRPKRHLQSPMVLEVPVGAVEAIPEGYSWSTDQTAQYVVDEVVVRRLSMSRETTRRGVALRVTAILHSRRFLHHADLAVELVAGGEVVASGAVDGFAIGRSLPAQGDGPGLEKRVVLRLDRETFDTVFGGDDRPTLRLRLTVRD